MTTPLPGIPWTSGIDDRTAAIDANNLDAATDSATDAEVSTAVAAEATARATADNLRVLKAGDTMTGALVLPGDPASALQASPKQYVDARITQVITNGVTATAPSEDAVFDALALKAPLASPTLTGVPATPALSVSGLTGATNTGRFVGFVSGAAPTSGTFLAKDWVFDNSLGCQWLCTVGGTPGTWVRAGASGMELGYAEVTNFSAVALTGSLADVAGLSTAVTVGTRPIFGTAYMPSWVVSWSAAGARNQIVVMEDGVVIATANSPGKSAASGSSIDAGSVSLPFRRAPAAGSHTYKVQARTLGSTSGNYTSGATFPAYITVVER